MSNVGKRGMMRIIACGGAGVTIAGNLLDPLKELGSGFSDIEVDYIDTSISNVRNFDYDENNFHLVKANGVNNEIDGSGGERRENSTDIVESVKEFIDKKNLLKHKTSTYYVVLASASGGTGSVIAPMVTKFLLEKNLPVLCILVGDSSNGLSTINTLNTIATFNSIAKKAGKPLNLVYDDNAKTDAQTTSERLKTIDVKIFKTLSVLSTFLSGGNTSLDQKDMVNFIDQSAYSTIGVKAGLYGLVIAAKEIVLPNYVTVTGIRSLTTEDVSPDVTGVDINQIAHYKSGTTEDNNTIATFKGQFPLHAVSYANGFTVIEAELKDKIDKINTALHNSTVDDVSGENEADDDGLVF